MPEFKIVSGSLDAVIQAFEQAFHITFPTHAAGGGASVQQALQAPPAPQAAQDVAHPIQEPLLQAGADGNVFGSFGPNIAQPLIEALNDPHLQELQAGADGNAFGSFGPNIALPLIEAINDPHRSHEALSDWLQAVAPWIDLG